MKKFILILFSLLLVFSFFTVSALPSKTNYLQGLSWMHGFNSTANNINGLYVEITNLSQPYSTALLNIAQGITKAFGDNNLPRSITFKIGGKIKADFKNDTDNALSLRLLIRAKFLINDTNSWIKKYHESLNGDAPFFYASGSNAYQTIKSNVPVTKEWSSFSTAFTVTLYNAFCEVTPDWNFCIDGIDLNKQPETIYFSDMFLYVQSVNNTATAPTATPKPTVTPTATPTPLIPPRVTPSRTLAPYSTPQGENVTLNPSATLNPTKDAQVQEDFLNQPAFKDAKNIIKFGFIGSAVIILVTGIFSIVVKIIRKRKKQGG